MSISTSAEMQELKTMMIKMAEQQVQLQQQAQENAKLELTQAFSKI